MKRTLLILAGIVFVIMISRSAFAYTSFFNNAGYNEDFASYPNGFKSSSFPFYELSRTWTGNNITFTGVTRSGIDVFNHVSGGTGLITLRSETIPVNTTSPLIAGIEFAVNSISGLNTSQTYIYVKEAGAYSYIAETLVPDLTANHWYYATADMFNVSAYNGKDIEIGLSFPMWTSPANLTIYVNRVVLGSVDTEELWNPEPNDAYLEALCNDEYTGYFSAVGSSDSNNLTGGMLYVKTFNLADNPNYPCMTVYYEGDSMLTVRPATGGFNETYGWATKHGYYDSMYCSDGADSTYIFTKDLYYGHHQAWSCCLGGCGSLGGGELINYLSENYTVGTLLGSWYNTVDNPFGYDIGIGGVAYVSMDNTTLDMYDLSLIYSNNFMAGGVVTGLNHSSTLNITGGTSYGDDRLTTKQLANPLSLSTVPTCTEGWRCTDGNEYHLSSSCSISDSNSCGDCGCAGSGLGYRCLSGNTTNHWICHSPTEAWHYNSTCSNDVRLLCDVSCLDGQCVGENACAVDADCCDYCSGATLYYNHFCNTTTYDCSWHSTQLCEFGCEPTLHACSSQPSSPPVFQNRTTQGIISEMAEGILGFLSASGGSIFNLLFFIFIVVVIISLFGLVGYIIKKAFGG